MIRTRIEGHEDMPILLWQAANPTHLYEIEHIFASCKASCKIVLSSRELCSGKVKEILTFNLSGHNPNLVLPMGRKGERISGKNTIEVTVEYNTETKKEAVEFILFGDER